MNKILTQNEIEKFREDGAVYLKNKFDIQNSKKKLYEAKNLGK